MVKVAQARSVSQAASDLNPAMTAMRQSAAAFIAKANGPGFSLTQPRRISIQHVDAVQSSLVAC